MIRTYAHLTVWAGDDDPADVTEALGLQPSRVVLKGSRGPGIPPGNSWTLSSEDDGSMSHNDENAHLRWVLDRIDGRERALASLRARGMELRMWVYWETDNAGPHVELQADVLRRLGELAIPLLVDAYRYDPTDE